MQMVNQLRQPRVNVDQPLREFLRMRGRIANALDAGNFGDVFEQRCEIDLRIDNMSAVRIDVLPKQRYLLDALLGQVSDFVSTSSSGRDTSSPRVYGTTQKLQYLLHPSMIDTNALAPSTRGGGR